MSDHALSGGRERSPTRDRIKACARDLYVRPAHRGCGLGKALLQRLGALAVQRGCGRFEWSVLDWNENAIRFYQRMGAQVLPDWRICRVSGDALQAFGPEGGAGGLPA